MIKILKQIKYAFEDIADNGFQYGVLCIQILVSLILFSYILTNVIDLSAYKRKMENIENTENIYMVYNISETERFNRIINDDTSPNKIYELYRYMGENFNTYSFLESTEIIPDNKANIKYNEWYWYTNKDEYIMLSVTERFADFFSLSCVAGEQFSKEDYNSESARIPVILGYEYYDYYKPGDLLGENYIVKGILNKSSFYFAVTSMGKEMIYLDKVILSPVQLNKLRNEMQDLDMSLLFFNTCIINTDLKELSALQNKLNELDLYKIKYVNFKKQINTIIKESNMEIQFYSTILLTILIFSIVGMISGLFEYMDRYKREFTIHMICGANSTYLALRILCQVSIIIFINNIILLIINGLSIESLLTFAFSLIVTLIITILPIIKLHKTNFNVMIKRSL